MEKLKEELKVPTTPPAPIPGDGKAVFIELGTDEEYDDYVMKEEKGWKNFYKIIFNPNETNSNEVISESDPGTDDSASSGGIKEGR